MTPGLAFGLCLLLSPAAGNFFERRTVSTTGRLQDAQLAGSGGKVRCASACAVSGSCFAFHAAANGSCLLLLRGTFAEQRAAEPQELWVHRGRACNSTAFPLSFGRSRYFVEKEQKNAQQAAQVCAARGGKLAQASSAAELQFLRDAVPFVNPTPEYVHLGAFKDSADGKPHTQGWRWRGSGEGVLPELWRGGQPDNLFGLGEFCAGFYREWQKLEDHRCSVLGKFVCECNMV